MPLPQHMLAFLRERPELAYTGAWTHLYTPEVGSAYVNKVRGGAARGKKAPAPRGCSCPRGAFAADASFSVHTALLASLQDTGESQFEEPEDYTLNEDTIVAHAICFHFSVRLPLPHTVRPQ